MPTTLDLLSEAACLTASLESPEGADPEVLLPALAEWLDASADKLGACWAVTRRFDADEEIIAAVAESCARKIKAIRGQRDRVKDLASALLISREGLGEVGTVKRPEFSAWLASSEAVLLEPEAVLPPELTRIKIEPDRTAIKAAIKSGRIVPGAEIKVTRSIRWKS